LIVKNEEVIVNTDIMQPQENQSNQVKYIDLFCGMGSFHYSFQKLGFKCVMASDIYKPAKENYKKNYNIDVLDDICDIEPSSIETYDILCAGFPCQPFSQAGQHKGFNDSRGTMFSQVMRFVKTNIPKVVILENVQALLNHDKGKSFAKIKEELEKEGYNVVYNVLKCSDYGIPQMRKRLFIVGFKNIEVNDLDNFFELSKYKKNTTLTDYLGQNFKKDVAYTLRCGGKHSPIDDRHNWDGYWVDDKEYRLTIDDGLKLQGFYNYDFVGKKNEKWKMLGNTIPTIFTEIIGKQLIKHCTF
jgi:DNA (cytosine-5)-methyltransferase 1